MKILVLSLVLLLQARDQLIGVWRNVNTHQSARPKDNNPLSAAQVGTIREALKRDAQIAECGPGESADAVLQKLRFERIQLSSSSENVLVQAGPGCLRGGQGSNGAMWIVQLNRGTATVLASQAEAFAGWIYSVQITTSKGYRDIVLGWHMSARETGLNYFRFDGTQYRSVSSAALIRDENGNETITPSR